MRIQISNRALGTTACINLPGDGILSYWQVRGARVRLKAPAGLPGAGPLGEDGPQRPPQTPGWEYRFIDLGDGRVQAIPHPIAEEQAG